MREVRTIEIGHWSSSFETSWPSHKSNLQSVRALKNVGIQRLQSAEHVIEGAVLHHEDDDVLEVLNTGQASIE
jgi:hypothetical protein